MTPQEIIAKIETNPQIMPFLNVVFSTENAKLKKNNIASFDLPKGSTCPFAGECLKYCYAGKGSYRFPNVTKKYLKNYERSLTDNFVEIVERSILGLPNIQFFRIHSSGDFYSAKYVAKWLSIASRNKSKIFYAYTKSMVYFKDVELPENFILIQSEGTINDNKYLDYSKPFARIFNTKIELLEAVESGNFLDASKNDLNAIKAVLLGKNIGLLKH
jgi:hypothetical protein